MCERCAVASNAWKRFVGLQGRASLAADEGLLFPRTGSIHMFFMRFPIDALFLSKPDESGERTIVACRSGSPSRAGH